MSPYSAIVDTVLLEKNLPKERESKRSISFINNAHMETHCKIQTGNGFVPREMDLLHKRGGGQNDKAIRYRDVSSLVPPCLYFTLYNDGISRVLFFGLCSSEWLSGGNAWWKQFLK